MKKQLLSIATLLVASFATAAGGMVFTDTINAVLPDHPSLNIVPQDDRGKLCYVV